MKGHHDRLRDSGNIDGQDLGPWGNDYRVHLRCMTLPGKRHTEEHHDGSQRIHRRAHRAV
eukprot:4382511-Amphidinium_carterae.1